MGATLMAIRAVLGLDDSEYNRGLDNAEKKSSVFAQVLKANIITKGVEVCAKGLTALAGQAQNVFKGAIDSFADYEQLVGGAQKIFGQMDYSKISKDAENAYKTMNMSASEYLAMMNSVGASFSQTMGDKKGYDTAKIGMQAIADYASGTGKSVTELNSKFAMITRSTSSYQSIADQFSGILPATNKDFLAQAQAAGYLSKSYKELTNVPVAEYQEAVAKMLQKGVDALGLTGNTAAESEKTLSGSLAAMRASWQNLITSFGEGNARQIKKNINVVATTAGNYLRNLLPIVKNILLTAFPVFVKSIVGRIPELAGQLVAALPSLWRKVNRAIKKDFIPMIARTISNFVGGGNRFTKMLTDNFRKDFRDIVGIFRAVGEKLAEVWTGVIQPVAQGVVRLITGTIMPNLFNLYRFHIAPLWEEISPKISATIQKISRLWTKTLYPTIQKVSRYILKDVAPKVVDFFGKQVLPAVSKVVDFVRRNLPIILSVVSGVVAGIMAYKIGQTITNTISIVQKVVGAAKALWAVLAANPIAVVIGAVVALVSYLVYLYNTNDDVKNKINAAWEAIKGYWENTLKPVFENLWKYVTETVVPAVVSAWNDTFLPAIESAWGAIKGIWENTLKPVFVALYDYVWRDLIPTLIVAWEYYLQPAIERVFNAIKGFWENTLKPAFTAMYDYVIRDLIPTLIVWWEYYLQPAIKGVFEGIKKWWEEYGHDALENFKDFVATDVIPVLESLAETFGWLYDNYLTKFADWFGGALVEALQDGAAAIGDIVELMKNVTSGNFAGALQNLGDLAGRPVKWWGEKISNAVGGNKDVGGAGRNPKYKKGAGRVKGYASGGILGPGELGVVGEYEPEWLQVINGRAVVTPMTGGSSRTIAQTPAPRTPINERPIEIVFELEGAQRWIYRLNKAEEQRVGLKLSTGGSY